MRKSLFGAVALAFAVASVCQSVQAQGTGAVTGTVRDSAGHLPLADVQVLVLGGNAVSATGPDGRWKLSGLPAGPHTVRFRKVGYRPVERAILVERDSVARVDVSLAQAATVLSPVVVSATRDLQRRSDGSVTVEALNGAEIRAAGASHPAELLNRLAGVHTSQTSGEGHMMAIRLPITTNPMYLYLEDGVPTRATGFFNHNALYEVNLPQAGGIEVMKGPGTALYGSDAIGGIVNVMTRPAPLRPSFEGSVEGGANGYRRGLFSVGSTWGNHGLRADLNLTHSDNWKELAPFDRQSGTLRWDAVLGGSGWTAKTVLTGSRIDQQDVPAVSRAIFDTATRVNLAPIAYRTVRAYRVSSAFRRESGTSAWSMTPYARIDDMGLLPSWQLSYDPQTWETKNNSVGFLASYRRNVAPMQGRIIAGLDGDLSPGSFKARQAVATRTGPYRAYTSYTDGTLQYDYDVTYRALSPYLQTEWQPLERLRLDVGVRSDLVGYDYHTRLAPLTTGAHRVPADTAVAYTHISPKVGATWTFNRAASLYGSCRNGFRAPSQGQLFTQNSAVNTVGLKPVKVNSFEVGMRGQFGEQVVYQVAAYSMTIRDDILTFITPQNTREATNAGRNRHTGVEASMGVALTPRLRVDLAWSHATHRYLEWTPEAATATTPAVSYSSNLMESAPSDLGNALVSWTPGVLRGGEVALEWSHTGRYAEDPGNTHFYDGYSLVNLRVRTKVTPRVELFVRAVNLTNEKYAELVAYDAFQKDTYTPGAPRSVFGGLRYAW